MRVNSLKKSNPGVMLTVVSNLKLQSNSIEYSTYQTVEVRCDATALERLLATELLGRFYSQHIYIRLARLDENRNLQSNTHVIAIKIT